MLMTSLPASTHARTDRTSKTDTFDVTRRRQNTTTDDGRTTRRRAGSGLISRRSGILVTRLVPTLHAAGSSCFRRAVAADAAATACVRADDVDLADELSSRSWEQHRQKIKAVEDKYRWKLNEHGVCRVLPVRDRCALCAVITAV